MKKKLIAALLILATLTTACSKKEDIEETTTEQTTETTQETEETEETEAPTPTPIPDYMRPDIVQIRNICQLATLQVYFHDVAKSEKPAASGIAGWGQADTRFWFEYSGYANLGIDMSRVTMTITDDEIYITIPPVEMIGDIYVDSNSYNADEIVAENPEWYQRDNPITASDMTDALAQANASVREEILNNNTLLMNAEQRAKDLIENYINNLAEYSGVEYNITWGYTGQ